MKLFPLSYYSIFLVILYFISKKKAIHLAFECNTKKSRAPAVNTCAPWSDTSLEAAWLHR